MGLGTALKGLFKGGAKPVMDGTNEILKTVDGLNTSQEEKAEIRSKVILAVIDAQSKAVLAEATSGSWLASNWRPMLATQWGFIVTYTYFLGPMLGLAVVPLAPPVFSLLTVMITGYAGARSLEKAAKAAVPLMTAKQKLKELKLKLKESD